MATFGKDMNFFTAPNLYYNKLPSIYPAHTSQARHNQVLLPRTQVGTGAINNQDQNYVPVGNANVLPFSKDSALGSGNATGKQGGADSQMKENWGPNQRQQRSKRWWKENAASGNSKSSAENSNGVGGKSAAENEIKPESPKFDLETSSFPPLPGCMEPDSIDVDVYQSRLSDIVKGTVKPTTRDTKTQTSESALVTSNAKDSSNVATQDAVILSEGAFTPPMSPDTLKEASSSEPVNDNGPEHDDWEDYVEASNDSSLCNTSINVSSATPDVSATGLGSNSSPAFHSIASNTMVNGSVSDPTVSSSVAELDVAPNVPSEVAESKPPAKLAKAKQLEPVSKNKPCDLPSPKNKTPDASSSKNKFDAFKERVPNAPKHRTSFSGGKSAESSSKERIIESSPSAPKTEHIVNKNLDPFPAKEKPNQGHSRGRILDNNKSKSVDSELSLLSVNGHMDSESTVSSEDEKPFRKLTYSEVAMRAKEKVEKIAQELKEKERQEAMVRQQRQQEIVAQGKQAATRGPFREFPRGRIVEPRPSSASGSAKEWKERRKPARTISIPMAGQ